MSDPVHTRETRMCGVLLPTPPILPGGQYIARDMSKSQSGTAFQAVKDSGLYLSEGILSFVEYAPRLLIVLPSRQFTEYNCSAKLRRYAES